MTIASSVGEEFLSAFRRLADDGQKPRRFVPDVDLSRGAACSEAEMPNDGRGIRAGVVCLAIEHKTIRSRDGTDTMPGHEVASTRPRRHLISRNPVGVADTADDLLGRTLQKHRKQSSTVPLNSSLELHKRRQVVRLDVHERHHNEWNAPLGRRAEDGEPHRLHEFPETWCPKLKDRARHVDRGVIVKQSPIDPTEQCLRRRQFAGARRSVDENELHRMSIAAPAPPVMPPSPFRARLPPGSEINASGRARSNCAGALATPRCLNLQLRPTPAYLPMTYGQASGLAQGWACQCCVRPRPNAT